MRDAGVNTALGTDNVANNNSYDLFDEMATTAKLMALRERRPNVIKAREILEMATSGGARALGLGNELGTLEAGKLADLITLDLNEVGWAPSAGQDLYTALVYAVNGAYDVVKRLAGKPDATQVPVTGGGVAFYAKSEPRSVYVAFPGTNAQTEVYSPRPAEAKGLVTAGKIVPIR